ncbi:hypothetical protein P153DRAFT_391229 [Dothidotthia symphoricarpi CBS 119687]|uniref:Uncharacterized protein n=1 Tax=Dothidotthia symphoricarpi CBS 119687 TaxID=1392245 RepID=A0A6A5ZZP9_9PLEO|nr:uncharacterized protein P153DRAFT_391229 [Dothidotthia symphoricarpi CBS 119687]KAF2123801.1 hypothetical protein P153DRAFT_391229 [Dothidotthia symphoricarpi CBS 119687]
MCAAHTQTKVVSALNESPTDLGFATTHPSFREHLLPDSLADMPSRTTVLLRPRRTIRRSLSSPSA